MKPRLDGCGALLLVLSMGAMILAIIFVAVCVSVEAAGCEIGSWPNMTVDCGSEVKVNSIAS